MDPERYRVECPVQLCQSPRGRLSRLRLTRAVRQRESLRHARRPKLTDFTQMFTKAAQTVVTLSVECRTDGELELRFGF